MEGVRDQDRQVEHAQPAGLALSVDEGFDIGMVAASVAIIAPRRWPALMMVRHMASHTSMKDKGPEASAPTPSTRRALGRRVEKS